MEGKWYLSYAAFNLESGHYGTRYLPLAAKDEDAAIAEATKLWHSDAVQVEFMVMAQGGLEYPPKNPQVVYVRGLGTVVPKPPTFAVAITLAQAGLLNDMAHVPSDEDT